MTANPAVYPPRLGTFLNKAWGKWRSGLSQGGLVGALRHELKEYKISCARARSGLGTGSMVAGLTGFELRAIDGISPVKPAARPRSPPPPKTSTPDVEAGDITA